MTRWWRIVRAAVLPLACRHLVTHRAAAAVVLAAIAAGVTSAVASQLVYGAVVRAYDATVTRFAGRAALQVTNGTSGVPEALVDEIRRLPGVRAVAASLEEFVAVPDLPGERLFLYGTDLLAADGAGDDARGADVSVGDPLVFIAEPDSVALTQAFLERHRLALEDRLRVLAPAGLAELTVRAALGAQSGVASTLDGRVAVVDLSVAQGLLRRTGLVSKIAIEVAAPGDVEAVARAVARVVDGRGMVERPRSRTAAFARLLAGYRQGLLLAAATAMAVALYLVWNVAALAVEERRRELGLLRLVGLGARAGAALIVLELALLAGAASMIGIPAGLGLARLLADTVGTTVAMLYLDVGVPRPMLETGVVLWACAVGMGLPLAAALPAILRVRALRPLEAVRPIAAAAAGPRRHVPTVLGLAVLIGAAGVWRLRAAVPLAVDTTGMLAMIGALLGVAVVVPGAVRWSIGAADRLATRHLGPVVQIAIRSLAAERGRVAVTCAAALVGLAGAIAIATWLTSLEESLHAAFQTVFANVDLVVSAGADPFTPDATRIDAAVVASLASVPGVAHADPLRITTIGFEGTLVAVIATDARAYRQGRRALSMVDGEPREAAHALASGAGVVVNQAFVRRLGRRIGDVIELATPAGVLALRIVGVHLEIAPGDLPVVRMDLGLYRARWRDTTASLVELALAPGTDRRRVADAVRTRFRDEHRLVVFTLAQVRREFEAMLGHLARLVRPLLIVAVATALVGIVSARLAAVLGRVRLTGVLRAVGSTQRQIGRIAAVEAVLLGGVTALLAALAGALLGALQVVILLRGMLGMSVEYAYPHAIATGGGIAVVVLTTVTGWGLGRHVRRCSVTEALRWE